MLLLNPGLLSFCSEIVRRAVLLRCFLFVYSIIFVAPIFCAGSSMQKEKPISARRMGFKADLGLDLPIKSIEVTHPIEVVSSQSSVEEECLSQADRELLRRALIAWRYWRKKHFADRVMAQWIKCERKGLEGKTFMEMMEKKKELDELRLKEQELLAQGKQDDQLKEQIYFINNQYEKSRAYWQIVRSYRIKTTIERAALTDKIPE